MHKLLKQIQDNKELLALEEAGFLRGDEKGKTMDVLPEVLMRSIMKQHGDLANSYHKYFFNKRYTEARKDLLQKIADIRNVAGCLFLKIVEEDTPLKDVDTRVDNPKLRKLLKNAVQILPKVEEEQKK